MKRIRPGRLIPAGVAAAVVAAFAVSGNASMADTLEVITVSDSDELAQALEGAEAGDRIVLADGAYEIGRMSDRHGTASEPIVVAAENRGEAVISDGQLEVLDSSYVTFEGLSWRNSDTLKITGSHHVRLTRNHFRLAEEESLKWVIIQGENSHHNRIDHNLFEEKHELGNFITIDGSETQQSQYDRIDHNHFRNIGPRANNEMEAIRVGQSAISESDGHTVIESNLFENCDGDPEIVSVKSNDNVVRYNTFLTSQGTVTQRHGNRGTFHGNFFLGGGKPGTGGIRLYGQDHLVFNNYFEGLTGTGYDAALQVDGGDVDTSGALSAHWRVYRATIVHNTFVNNVSNIEVGANYELPPVDSVIADNVVVGGEGKLFNELMTPRDMTYAGNIAWPTGSATVGDVPDGGVEVADPLLVGDGAVRRIAPDSPAVDAATGGFDVVTDDMDGQARDGEPDAGADEYGPGEVTRGPLTAADVGPDAENPDEPDQPGDPDDPGEPGDPDDSVLPVVDVAASDHDGNVPENTLDGDLTTRWSAEGDGVWISYDLGATHTVGSVSLAWHRGDTRTHTFDVELSEDGSTWTTALAGQRTSGATTAAERYDIADGPARHVRIVGYGNTDNDWTSITETTLHGRAPGAEDPDTPDVTRVSTATELQDALDEAEPGDTIAMADGVYDAITLSNSGTEDAPITLTGSPDAVIDGGDNGSGYAVDLRADHWRLTGFTVRAAKKGVMATGASGNVLDGLEVYDIGEEGVHFRRESSDNVVRNSFVHDTGQVTADYGEAIYLGSAENNWDDGPDRSDRNRVLDNRLGPNVTAEHVDIKEGSTGGEIRGNTFDGTGQTGANSGESWVSAKGNGYVIAENHGEAAYMSGFKSRVRVAGWGCGNVFQGNTGSVAPYEEDGWGFDVVNDDCAGEDAGENVVCDDNEVTDAALGESTVALTDCDGDGGGGDRSPAASASATRPGPAGAGGLPAARNDEDAFVRV
ncbi:chondroitinase-B domain-containing protein [Streptomyces sp. 4N509B]|uniref:chondroitinase-B domain-containing protein n=1 Tax=Streptomyces sp. 4N509B TaxID=3457413 RepID=UPI003FD2B7BC